MEREVDGIRDTLAEKWPIWLRDSQPSCHRTLLAGVAEPFDAIFVPDGDGCTRRQVAPVAFARDQRFELGPASGSADELVPVRAFAMLNEDIGSLIVRLAPEIDSTIFHAETAFGHAFALRALDSLFWRRTEADTKSRFGRLRHGHSV